MYFVDQNKIANTLTFLEKELLFFQSIEQFEDETQGRALERSFHLIIECILDVGNDMIDGFIMRDAGSYEDIIDILEDEKVVNTTDASSLKALVRYRKVLVLEYQMVNRDDLFHTLTAHLSTVLHFPTHIRTYLKNELGPVSAFK